MTVEPVAHPHSTIQSVGTNTSYPLGTSCCARVKLLFTKRAFTHGDHATCTRRSTKIVPTLKLLAPTAKTNCPRRHPPRKPLTKAAASVIRPKLCRCEAALYQEGIHTGMATVCVRRHVNVPTFTTLRLTTNTSQCHTITYSSLH